MHNKLIIALDVETAAEARRLFSLLGAQAGMFKIGSQLFTAAGPEFVREIVSQGGRVFLDLKFHDIPNTVAAACREVARLGVSLFNVHAAGGGEMMRRAAEATNEIAARENLTRPKLIAVTVLTSANADVLRETGVAGELKAQVKMLAELAARSGLDGVVASPHEIVAVRSVVKREDFLLVTPGVRPANAPHDDQRRVMTPAEAMRAGADYIVVGRAILNARDPQQAAQEIAEEMQRAAAAESASSKLEDKSI